MSLGRLGPYEILDRIGQGGMGVVFRARDSRLDRIVALKVLAGALAQDPQYRSRLQREARAEASLNHSNIATCFEIGEAVPDPPDLLGSPPTGIPPGPVLYLAIEFVAGTDLLTLSRTRRLRLGEILDLAIQIGSGLEAAHAAGVVHRDLKPGNILVTAEGRVKILDFGLAKVLRTSAPDSDSPSTFDSSEGKILGTAFYMSPEQARGNPVDPRSDLFSFGIVLYQLVAGQAPFTGTTYLEVLYSIANEEPPPLAHFARDAPDELERIVRKLLAKDPAERYQSAHETVTDLTGLARREGFLPGSGSAPRPAAGWTGAPAWSPARSSAEARGRRLFTRIGIVALVVVAAALGIWDRWFRRPRVSATPVSLAVLPFLNLTGDPGLEYLSEGIAAAVLSDLVRLSDFNVVSQSTAWSFRGSNKGAAAIARELGVASILEGSVEKRGGNLRLDVRLVNGKTGYVLWSGRFEEARERIFRLEEDIVASVTRSVTGRPAPSVSPGTATPTRSLEAYDEYLHAGRFLGASDDPKGPDLAAARYARAIALDPDFALAYAGESRALWKIYSRDRDPEVLARAEEAAERAVDLNPGLLDARLARAQIFRGTSRYAESIAELLEVLAVNPNWDEAHLQLAAAYRDAGDLARAEASFRHAVSLRPDYWNNWNSLGAFLLVKKRDYEGARKAFGDVIRLAPERNRGYENLAALELLEGKWEEASLVYERLPAPIADGGLATNVGISYFYTGQLEKALEFFLLAVRLEPKNHAWHVNLGDLHTRQGKPKEAGEEYREALRLVEKDLALAPEDRRLGVERAVCLAKAGDCGGAREALDRILPSLPADDAEIAHSVAKAYAVCGLRAEAVEALGRAIRLGSSPEYIREEDEFRSVLEEPSIAELLASRARSR